MSRYLDPKADLTFKKVFGEHPDLVISFLNALLPFESAEDEIKEVEYLPSELVPDNPLRKDSIVDVRCRDNRGRQFIVEMQMLWSPEFMQRVLFNASKAYVRQLDKAKQYELLQPVYSLNLVNEVYETGLDDEYYHYYRMVHEGHTDRVIDGLHLVFIELPKFKPHNYSEKRMQVLWLRYLTEISDNTSTIPQELLANDAIRKAVDQLEESAFTEEQMLAYDKFWDMVSVERILLENAMRKGLSEGMAKGIEEGMAKGIEAGMAKGIAKGRAEGIAEGIAEGMQKGRIDGMKETVRRMKEEKFPVEVIAKLTGLSVAEIEMV